MWLLYLLSVVEVKKKKYAIKSKSKTASPAGFILNIYPYSTVCSTYKHHIPIPSHGLAKVAKGAQNIPQRARFIYKQLLILCCVGQASVFTSTN